MLPRVLAPAEQTRPERLLVALLVALGLVARAAFLFDGPGGTLAKAYPTEDGYLMLTIARNIGLGHGMSIADGTIATNGTQPAMTCVYALGFWLVGGDKTLGIKFAMVVDIVAAVASLLLWAGLARHLLRARPAGERIAVVAAAFWFAAPRVVDHGLNCLETSAYGVCVLLVVRAMLRFDGNGARGRWHRALALGALLGVTFWVRNDAAFLTIGVCLALLLVPASGTGRQRLAAALVTGGTSLLIAMPWLVNNRLRFGSIVPISGQLEAMDGEFGDNVGEVFASIVEYLLFAAPLPRGLREDDTVAACAALVSLAALVLAWRRWRHAEPPVRRLGVAMLVFLAGASIYYGLFFGVEFFVSRYLYPFSPFLVLATVCMVADAARQLPPERGRRLLNAAGCGALIVAASMLGRLCLRGFWSQHQQVVEWVRTNVPDDAWVGAVQSGTLGYYHDRTINLDGKVNPEALLAAYGHRTQEYAYEHGIQYLCDQNLMAEEWRDLPVILDHFDLVVDDPDRGYQGLAVFRRR